MFGVVVKRKFVYKPVGVNTAAGDPLGVFDPLGVKTPRGSREGLPARD